MIQLPGLSRSSSWRKEDFLAASGVLSSRKNLMTHGYRLLSVDLLDFSSFENRKATI